MQTRKVKRCDLKYVKIFLPGNISDRIYNTAVKRCDLRYVKNLNHARVCAAMLKKLSDEDGARMLRWHSVRALRELAGTTTAIY